MPSVSGKLSIWINVVVSVLGALSTGAALFSDLFGQGPTKKIMAGVGLAGLVVGAVNAALHGAGGTGVAPPASGQK